MRRMINYLAFCSGLLATAAAAEPADVPAIAVAAAGDAVVTGRAMPGSAPITVFDLAYPVQTALGSGNSMDNDGNFAVEVSPNLIVGHEIIAVDAQGRSSRPLLVGRPPDDVAEPQR